MLKQQTISRYVIHPVLADTTHIAQPEPLSFPVKDAESPSKKRN